MNRETPSNNQYLGADTLISPEVVALLKAPYDKEKHEKTTSSGASSPDDYEQVLGF